MKTTSVIGKITKMLGTKIREVSDDFDDLHESVIARWKSRTDYRPENLKKKHGANLEQK